MHKSWCLTNPYRTCFVVSSKETMGPWKAFLANEWPAHRLGESSWQWGWSRGPLKTQELRGTGPHITDGGISQGEERTEITCQESWRKARKVEEEKGEPDEQGREEGKGRKEKG